MPWQTLEAINFDRPVKCFLPHRGCIFEYIILICFKPFAYFTPFAHLWDVFSSRKGRCPCSFFWVGVPPAFASGAKSGTSTSPTCRPSDSGSGSSGWCPLGFIHGGQQPDPFKKKLQDMSPTIRWRTYKKTIWSKNILLKGEPPIKSHSRSHPNIALFLGRVLIRRHAMVDPSKEATFMGSYQKIRVA